MPKAYIPEAGDIVWLEFDPRYKVLSMTQVIHLKHVYGFFLCML